MQDSSPPPLDAFFLFTEPEQFFNADSIKLKAMLRAGKKPKEAPIAAVNSIKLRAAKLLKEESSHNHQPMMQ